MFHPDPDYPLCHDEVLDPPLKLRKGVLPAARKFKALEPWKGTLEQRIVKFLWVVNELSKVYGIKPPVIHSDNVDRDEPSDGSYYQPMTHAIYLRGRLSVITLLHEFAHSLGRNEYGACRWSLCVFKRAFPKQWNRLVWRGHVARRRSGG